MSARNTVPATSRKADCGCRCGGSGGEKCGSARWVRRGNQMVVLLGGGAAGRTSQPMQEGEVGAGGTAYVRWIQEALNKVLRLRLPVNGIAGAETRSATRSFQQRHRLKVDGIVGPKTEGALISAAGLRPPGKQLAQPTIGASGTPYVRWVQQALNKVLGLRLPVNGVAGVETRSAIRSFQRSRGLKPDSIVGPATHAALLKALKGAPAASLHGTAPGVAEGVSWVNTTQGGLVGQIFFDTRSYQLDDAAYRELQKLAIYETIVNDPRVSQIHLEFHGFADHRRYPAEGGNPQLSRNRAKKAREFVENIYTTGGKHRLHPKFVLRDFGFGVHPQSKKLPSDAKLLRKFRRVDIYGPPSRLPEKIPGQMPQPAQPVSRQWAARVLWSASGGPFGASAEFAKLEIVDRKNKLRMEYQFRAAGASVGAPIGGSPMKSKWSCFVTTREINIGDFEGFASRSSVHIPPGVTVDRFFLSGPWMRRGAGLVIVCFQGVFEFGIPGLSATIGGLHPDSKPMKIQTVPPCETKCLV